MSFLAFYFIPLCIHFSSGDILCLCNSAVSVEFRENTYMRTFLP